MATKSYVKESGGGERKEEEEEEEEKSICMSCMWCDVI